MARAGGNQHALGGTGFAADHQVVTAQVEVLESHGHEWQQRAIMPPQGIEERRRDMPLANGRAHALRIVEQREQVGVGQQAAQRFQHGLAASLVEEPVMHYSYTHRS